MNESIKVSQLTAYERRRLNNNRICKLCGEEIKDYEPIIMNKKRDRHKVYYEFTHAKCELKKEKSD